MRNILTKSLGIFSPSGLVLLATCTVTLLAAWNTGANLYYLVTAGALSLLLLALAFSRLNLRRLTVNYEAPQAVHRGEPFGFMIRAENRKRFLHTYSINIAIGSTGAGAFVVSVPPGKAADLRLSHRFDKRGVFLLPEVTFSSSFPFGLCRVRRVVPQEGEIVVYPRVWSLRTRELTPVSANPATRRLSLSQGDEFFALRDYAPGDDIRHIAWRASARVDRLLVKDLEQEHARYIMLIFDTRLPKELPDAEERFEEAVEVAASLAITLLQGRFSVSIVTPSWRLEEGDGHAQALKILDFLARVQYTEAPGLGDFAEGAVAEECDRAAFITISADPRQWGLSTGGARGKVLDPREIVRA
jgi:uncharacterized protein (DUF58 family)